MQFKSLTKDLFEQFWPEFERVIKAQQTYAFDPDMSFEQAFSYWVESAHESYAVCDENTVLGIYYLRANGQGPASHICNCGYMVASFAGGKGVATKMCLHSQQRAIALSYSAMQFNSVVSTNTHAVALWKKLGFEQIGRVPKGYQHKELGLVDTIIMHKALKP